MPKPISNPPDGGRVFETLAVSGPYIRRRRPARRRRAEEVAAQVRRYGRSQRMALLSLARDHPRFEDLLFSCPIVAASLADRRGPAAARGEAMALLRQGAAFGEVFAALELPLWLRKLTPEGCVTAPPWPFPGDPGRAALEKGGEYDPRADAEFGRRALSLLPVGARAQNGFLRWLSAARGWMDDEFALWLLAARLVWGDAAPESVLPPLIAYVWFSRRPAYTASAMLPRAWTPAIPLSAALRDARRWRLRLCFAARRRAGESPFWGEERRVRGYAAAPLTSLEAFVGEGSAMKNCMASYAEPAAMGVCRVYALQRGGKSVADFEIRAAREPGATPRIVQILGPRNAKPSAAALAAAQLWLEQVLEAHKKAGADPAEGFAPPDPAAWRAVLEPFLEGAVGASLPRPATLESPAQMGVMLLRLERMASSRPELRLDGL